MRLFIKLLKLLLTLLEKKEVREEVKDVNQEVYQEIKDTPSANQVEIDTIVTTTITNPEPIIQPTTNLVPNPKIIERLLPPSQYVQDSKFIPNQIVLHHTNGHSWQSTYNYWNSDKNLRVATHFLIDRDGSIVQCIPLDKAWGFHINIAARDNKIPKQYKNLGRKYDSQSIGIELCSMSQLVPYGDKFLDTYGKVFKGEVTKLDKPFRGFEYFESYTEKQISALESLLLYLLNEYPKIKQGLYENYEDKFDINMDALNMKPGVYFHVNYRTGTKWDLYPQPELIQMLNQLHTKVI